MASDCKDDDCLSQAEVMIKGWLADEDFGVVADDIFYGESVDLEAFKKTLEKLLTNISKIRKMPVNEREYEIGKNKTGI